MGTEKVEMKMSRLDFDSSIVIFNWTGKETRWAIWDRERVWVMIIVTEDSFSENNALSSVYLMHVNWE